MESNGNGENKQTRILLSQCTGTGTKLGWLMVVIHKVHTRTHAHTHTFNGLFSGTTWVSQYQKGKTNLDFTEAGHSQWQWHQLGHMQVCTSLQTHNHTSTPPLGFLQARCPSCCPTNIVKAPKKQIIKTAFYYNVTGDRSKTAKIIIT